MKPKLLVFTSTFPRWRDDTDPPFVYELSRRLTTSFEVYVLTPYYPGSKAHEIIDDIHVIRFRYFFGKYQTLAGGTGILPTLKKNRAYWLIVPFFLFFGFISLALQTRKLKPAVIHAHWLLPQGFLAACATLINKVPVIVTLHGADAFALNNKLFFWLKKYTLNRASKITVVSSAVRDVVNSITAQHKKCVVLPMGVDSEKFLTDRSEKDFSKNRPLKILFVGRLSEKKGVEYLLDSLTILKEKNIQFISTVVGHGELEKKLKDRVRRYNLSDKVNFIGGLPNNSLPAIYKSHDIFVGPSITAKDGDTEGFGLTFVEAGMAGCLLIGTNIGGITDIIEHGKTGFLVEQKSGESIAESIFYALDHSEEVEVIINKCREQCFWKFEWSIISKEYARVINKTFV